MWAFDIQFEETADRRRTRTRSEALVPPDRAIVMSELGTSFTVNYGSTGGMEAKVTERRRSSAA